MNGNDKLIKDLYAKYAPDQQLTDDRISAIEQKYEGDHRSLISDFYGKYAPDQQLTDDRMSAIEQKYGIEKKNPNGTGSEDSEDGSQTSPDNKAILGQPQGVAGQPKVGQSKGVREPMSDPMRFDLPAAQSSSIQPLSFLEAEAQRGMELDSAIQQRSVAEINRVNDLYKGDGVDINQAVDSLSSNMAEMQSRLSFMKRHHQGSQPEANELSNSIDRTQNEIDAAKVVQIAKSPKDNINRYGELFDRFDRLPQTHKDALREDRDAFEKSARDIIDSEIEDYSEYTGASLSGFSVDEAKAMDKAADIADIYGGGGRFKQLVYERIKSESESEFYKKKSEISLENNPKHKEIQSKISSRIVDDFSETSKSLSERDSVLLSIDKELSEALDMESADLYKSYEQSVGNLANELTGRISSGQITEDAADIHFQNAQSEILSEYLTNQSALSNKLQGEFARRSKIVASNYAEKIQEEWSKFDKELTSEEMNELKQLYADTYSDIREGENTRLNNIDKLLPSSFVFARGSLASVGRSIAATSSYLGIDGGVVLGDKLSRIFEVGYDPMEEWKDVLDAGKMTKSSANLAGSMAGSMLAGAAAASATGGLGTVPALVASGLAGWAAETVDMAGEIRRNTLSATGSESKASDAASQMVDAQVSNMAYYSLGGVPFVSNALRGIRSIPLRILAGGSIETGEEFVQEFRQGAQERAITERGDWTKFDELMTPDAAKETLLNIAPVFFMGAGGQVRSGMSDIQIKKEAKTFASKMAAAGIAPGMLDQYLYQITMSQGGTFSRAVVSSWVNNGVVSKESAQDVMGMVDSIEETKKNSAAFSLSDKDAFTYFSLMTEYNSLKRQSNELAGDEIMRDKINQQANEIKKSASEFLDSPTTGGKFARVTFGEETYIMNESEVGSFIAENIDEIVDGTVSVSGRNIDTNTMIENARKTETTEAEVVDVAELVGELDEALKATESENAQAEAAEVEADGFSEEVRGSKVFGMLGKRASFYDPVLEQTVEGDVYLDGQTVVIESNGRITELGTVEEMSKLEELPIKDAVPAVSVNESQEMVYQGGDSNIPAGTIIKPQQPGLKSIKRDKDGFLKRVVVTDGKGNTYNLEGQEAIDVAYEIMMAESNSPAFELKLREDEAIQREIESELAKQDKATPKGSTTQNTPEDIQQGDGGGVDNTNQKTQEDVREENKGDDVQGDSTNDDTGGTREGFEAEIEEVEREREVINLNKQRVAVRNIRTEPTIFQFKAADDATSGTNTSERLEGEFDEDLAGSVAVWVDENNEVGNGAGEIYVVDGHHRMELAKRQGVEDVNVYYIQAPTAKKARLKAAMANISQGRGTAIDAAKVYRDASEGEMEGFVPKSKVGRDGLALSKLSDSIFNAVVQGKMPVNQGVIIGESISSIETQEQFYQEIKGRNLTLQNLKLRAEDANNARTESVTVADLFGETVQQKAEIDKRYSFIESVRSNLSKAKNLLGRVGKGKEFLEKYGNIISEQENLGASKSAAEALGIFDALRKTSEVKDIIDSGLERIDNGESSKSVSADISKKLTKVLPKIIEAESRERATSSFESSMTKGLGDAVSFLDDMESQLDEFGKESLSMGLPVAAARIAINAAKVALKTTKVVSEVVDAAVRAVKDSDWYKGLDSNAKEKAVRDTETLFTKADPLKSERNNTEKDAKAKAKEKANQSKKEAVNRERSKAKEDVNRVRTQMQEKLTGVRKELRALKARDETKEKKLASLKKIKDDLIAAIDNILPENGVVSRSIAKAIAGADTISRMDKVIDRIDRMNKKSESQQRQKAREDLISQVMKFMNPKNFVYKKGGRALSKSKISPEAQSQIRSIGEVYDSVKINQTSDADLVLLHEMLSRIFETGRISQRDFNKWKSSSNRDLKNRFTEMIADKKKLSRTVNTVEDAIAELEKKNIVMVGDRRYSSTMIPEFKADYGTSGTLDAKFVIIPSQRGPVKKRILGYYGRSIDFLSQMYAFMTDADSKSWVIENLYRPIAIATKRVSEARYEMAKKESALKKKLFGNTRKGRKKLSSDADVDIIDLNGEKLMDRFTNDHAIYLFNIIQRVDMYRKALSAGITEESLDALVNYVKKDKQLLAYANGMIELYQDFLPSVNEALKITGEQTIEGKKIPSQEALANRTSPEFAENYYRRMEEVYGAVPEMEPYTPASVLGSEVGNIQDRRILGQPDNAISVVSNNAIDIKAGGELQVASNLQLYDSWVEGMANMREKLDLAKTFNAVFNKQNMNLIENNYGKPYADALRETIDTMLAGRRAEKITSLEQWFNSASGVTMFLNTASSIFQQLSKFNYGLGEGMLGKYVANWSKAYWSKDYRQARSEVSNASWVRARLLGDLSSIELADLKKSNTKYQRYLSEVLSKGYILTKAMDINAIISGGTPYYMAKRDQYLKVYSKTMSANDAMDAAKTEAMNDLYIKTQEGQQSSEMYQRSSEQNNTFKRFLLTFGSVNLQYARVTGRAARDLKNGRGNAVENLATILYYSTIQQGAFIFMSRVFSSWFLGDDDDEEKYAKQTYWRVANGVLNSFLAGMGAVGALSAVVKDIMFDTAISLTSDVDSENTASLAKDLREFLRDQGMSDKDLKGKRINQLVYTATRSVAPNVGSKISGLSSMLYDFSEDRPFRGTGELIQFATNIPTSRMVDLSDQVIDAMDSDLESMERTLRLVNIIKKYDLDKKYGRGKEDIFGSKKSGSSGVMRNPRAN